jgi:hypothetical protein
MGLGKWVGQPICGTLWHYTQVFKILLLKNMGSSRRLSGDLYVDLQQGDFWVISSTMEAETLRGSQSFFANAKRSHVERAWQPLHYHMGMGQNPGT